MVAPDTLFVQLIRTWCAERLEALPSFSVVPLSATALLPALFVGQWIPPMDRVAAT